LTSYFLFECPYFFPYLIALIRTYSTVLNKIGESGHPCLVPDLRVNAFSFSPLSVMPATAFIINGFYCLYSLYA
jgi:hypothetical protein